MADTKTKLDDDTTKPATVQPGDAPADTTDPAEIAQSTPPQPGDDAKAAGTVNAVTPAAKPKTTARKGKERTEKYTAVRPDGSEVKITRNIETGETSVDES